MHTYQKLEELKRLSDHVDIEVKELWKIPDQKQLSVWYFGDVLEFSWGRCIARIRACGAVGAHLYSMGDQGKRTLYQGYGKNVPSKAGAYLEDDSRLLAYVRNHRAKQQEGICLELSPNRLEADISHPDHGKRKGVALNTKNIFLSVEELLQILPKISTK